MGDSVLVLKVLLVLILPLMMLLLPVLMLELVLREKSRHDEMTLVGVAGKYGLVVFKIELLLGKCKIAVVLYRC